MSNRTVSVNLVANIGQYVSGMNTAAGATMRLGDTAQANSKKAQSGFDLAGKGALIMGAAVVGGFAMAISKSADFEKSMSGVQAATRASASDLDDLRSAAMKAGADTAYSAGEAAQAITEMAKAGVSTADILDGGLNGALSLAAAGELEVAKAAEIASAAMTQFSLSGDELPHVADLLAAGAGKALGSVEDMGMALNQAGLVASAAGLSIEETTGTLAAFASAGLVGSDAGTSLRSALLHLQNATGPAKETMDEYGISLYDAQGQFVGMSALAGQLQEKMGGLTPAVRDAAMAQIFGSDAVRAANVLYKEGAAGITDWIGKVDDAGYAAEEAAIKQDNLAGDLEKLGGAFDTLLIKMGEGAQGPLRDLVQGLTMLVDAIGGDVEAFLSLPAPVRLALDAFGGLFDIVGAVAGAFGSLDGPMQIAILAAAGWAVAGDRIMGILGPMGGALSPLRGTWSAFGDALGYARANGDGLSTVLKSVGDTAGGAALSGIKSLGRAIGPELAVGGAVLLVTQLVDGFQALTTASDEAKGAAEGLAKSLTLTNDALDRETVRSAIEDVEGLTEILANAGVSSRDAIDGLLGHAGAQDRVTEALLRYRGTQDKFGDINVETVRQAQLSYEELATGYDGAAGSARYFKAESDGAAAGTKGTGDAAVVAAPQVDQFTAAMDAAKEQVDAAKQSVDDFKLSLDILTGAHVSMIQVESAFQAAVAEADGALENMNGTVLDGAGNLNLQSESGRQTADVLLGVRDSGNQLIATMLQQGFTTDEVRAKDAQLRESFIRSAMQMGISRDAALRLADQILGIPAQRETKITADTGPATRAVDDLVDKISRAGGYTMVVSGGGVQGGRTGQDRATGAVVSYYAEGGLRPMRADVAEVVPANSWRVIGDRPVGDEAFIPINNSSRSASILAETAARMGYGLADARFLASGAILEGSYAVPVHMTAAKLSELEKRLTPPAGAVGSGSATASASSLVAFGRWLQSRGARVSEHPAFGGVAMNGHGKTSKHYVGKAIDVNTRAGTSALEQRELDPLMAAARAAGFQVIWRAPGHFNHGHVASYETGTPYVPQTGMALLHQGEAVIPARMNPYGREFSGAGRNASIGGARQDGPVQMLLQLDRDAVTDLLEGRVVQTLGTRQAVDTIERGLVKAGRERS